MLKPGDKVINRYKIIRALGQGGMGKVYLANDELLERQVAVKILPKGVPVNTLLFPIEGDPGAASSFWGLAIASRGSFITPSRDWP